MFIDTSLERQYWDLVTIQQRKNTVGKLQFKQNF